MQYTSEIEILLPRQRVVELFDNPDNLSKWMPGLLSFEHVKGVPGQVGAQSRLTFQMGKRNMVMTETVTVRNLPDEFSGTYETNGVVNEVRNKFIAIDEGRTKYISESIFNFSGIMKFIAPLMKGTFKKTSLDYLVRFKAFAEAEGVK